MSMCRPSVQYVMCVVLMDHANASLQAQSPTSAGALKSPTGQQGDEVYQQDGDYIKDIEVNDLRNRYTLTKGSTQKMVNLTHF